MTWKFDRAKDSDQADQPGPHVATMTLYPDTWWADEFWMARRGAAKYQDVLSQWEIPPWDPDRTADELENLMEKQASAEAAVRRPEIIEENNAPPPYYSRMLFLDFRRPLTRALIFGSVPWSVPLIMHFKAHFKRPRPTQLEPRLRPVVDVPGHPAYPSGHSTQSHLIALIGGAISGREDVQSALWLAANRIAENREYAGLHYPSDSACGVALSKLIAEIYLKENEDAIAAARKAEWS
jgi:hypothetical protein